LVGFRKNEDVKMSDRREAEDVSDDPKDATGDSPCKGAEEVL
jgi:hypothetical protein